MFSDYTLALAALACWGLLVLALSGLSLRGRTPENRTESGLPKRNYAEPSYRAYRAYANAMESSPPFMAGLLACIMLGAAPFWVNGLAAVFILSRIAMAYIHIATENQAARSGAYGIGWLCMLALGLIALISAITG